MLPERQTSRHAADLIFRPIKPDELDRAHAILVDAVRWLNARNIRQWTVPYPMQLYAEAQGRGENFGLFDDSVLLAIVTIWHGEAQNWKDETGRAVWWMSRLAVSDRHRGQGFGRVLTERAFAHLRQQSATDAWLDCVQGRLPGYYASLGFERMAQKIVAYPRGELEMVLMRRHFAKTCAPRHGAN